MDLEGGVALVTGGGRRVGRAIALALGARGARVAVHFRTSRDEARRTADELTQGGAEAWALQADLAEPAEVERLFDDLVARAGRLDVLVNSAASFEGRAFEEIDAAAWDEVLAINLRAPFLCLRRAAPLLAAGERRGGKPGLAVNIGDLSALQAWRGYAHHSVSKAGLLHLTRVAAVELAPRVRVNALVPGAILPPPGTDPAGADWRKRGERVPLARTGEPREIGHAIVALAENDFITGAILPIDGGEGLARR